MAAAFDWLRMAAAFDWLRIVVAHDVEPGRRAAVLHQISNYLAGEAQRLSGWNPWDSEIKRREDDAGVRRAEQRWREEHPDWNGPEPERPQRRPRRMPWAG